MKTIKLSNNRVAIVDDIDYSKVSKYRWYLNAGGYVQCESPYLLLHRKILNAPKGTHVDHKNRNKLDNRRYNLRLCSRSQNSHNSPKRKNNTSGFKGVYLIPSKRWIAKINIQGQRIFLGTFDTKEQAIKEYKKYAQKVLKDFVNFN